MANGSREERREVHEMPPRESGRDANHRPYLDGSTQGRGIRALKHITDRTSSTVAPATCSI